MAADTSYERQQYIFALQSAAKATQALNNQYTNLLNLYNGGGLSGTFLDADLAANNTTKQMLAADVATFTSNIQTIQTAMSSAIIQNMAKCVGASI